MPREHVEIPNREPLPEHHVNMGMLFFALFALGFTFGVVVSIIIL